MARQTIRSRRGAIVSGRHEFQRCTIDAISKAGRFRAIFEDMTLMAVAPGAMDLRAREDQFEVGAGLDDLRIDRLPKARPSGAAVELVFGRIDGEVAARAVIDAGFLVVVEGMGKGSLGCFVSQHLIAVRREQLFPFVIGFYNLGNRSNSDLLRHRDSLAFNNVGTNILTQA